MGWICTKCGNCCRHVGDVPSMASYARPDGSCKFLENNICTIYENRPPICNVAWVYEHFFKGKVSEEEFYQKTEEACEKLRME